MLQSVYSHRAKIALRSTKCKTFVLRAAFTPELDEAIKGYVAKVIPRWSDFQITNVGECLGFWIGPAGGTKRSLEKPLAQSEARVAELSAGAYVEQLCAITPEVCKDESFRD